MKEVAIAGYYGFDNAGDEAILAAIISSLRQKNSDLRITVLSANPVKTAQTYGVRAVDRFSFFEIIKTFSRMDLFLSGGGSLLQDVTSQKSMLYYLGLIYLAKKMGVPVMFYAQGVGPVTGKLGRVLVPKVLKRVEKITVRDKKSKELLVDLGVKNQIEVTADPVFNLPLPAKRELRVLVKQEELDLKEKVIGVSVRYWPAGDDDYLATLAKVLDRINNKLEVSICFLPLHYPVDLEASREVREKMKSNTQILTGNYHPRQIAGLFKKIDLLIGVRLHSLIFAAINRVPMVAISYDPKIDSFLARLDLQPVGTVNDLRAAKLHKRILETWRKREKLKIELSERVTELEQLEEQNSDLTRELLKNLG